MKISQVMISRGFGGAERYFVDLSIALSEAGHDVQVVCHKNFMAVDQFTQQGKMRIDTVSPLGWWDVVSWRYLYKAISEFNPEIVHAHLARGAYIAGKACVLMKKPLIVKTHNYVNLKYYKNVDFFIATTNDQREYLIKKGISSNNIDVIPNFSSVKPADKVQIGSNPVLNIAAYGRLVKIKGMHVLLKAFNEFIKSGRQATLHIGGKGPEEKRLKILCRELGLSDYVFFHGWVDNVTDFVCDKDIVILPSLSESFGIVVLEAIALGKPLIATRTKGPMQILDEEISYLVAPGDAYELANAMCNAADDPAGRIKKAEHALKQFKNLYARNQVVPRIIESYCSAIKNYSAAQ